VTEDTEELGKYRELLIKRLYAFIEYVQKQLKELGLTWESSFKLEPATPGF
jgi:hypothetical protein